MPDFDELERLANGKPTKMQELESLANGKDYSELEAIANGNINPQSAAAQSINYSEVLPKLNNNLVRDAVGSMQGMSEENRNAYAPKILGALEKRDQVLGDIKAIGQVLGINDAPQLASQLLDNTRDAIKRDAKPVLDIAQPAIEGGKTIAHGISRLLRAPKEYTTHNLYTPYTEADRKAGVEEGISIPGVGHRRAAQIPFTDKSEGINHPVSEEEWNRRLSEKHPVAYGGAKQAIGGAALSSIVPLPGVNILATNLLGESQTGKKVASGVGEFIINNALDPTTYASFGGSTGAKVARQVERAAEASVGAARAAELGKLSKTLLPVHGTPEFTERLVAGLVKEGVNVNDIIKVFGKEGEHIGRTGLRLSLPGEIAGIATPGIDLAQVAGKLSKTEHHIIDAAQAALGSRFKLPGYTTATLANQLAKDRQLEEVLKAKYLKKSQAIQQFEALIPEARKREIIEGIIDPHKDNLILGAAPLQKHEQQWVKGITGITKGLRRDAKAAGAVVPLNKNPISGMYWHRMYEPKALGKIADKVIGKSPNSSPMLGRVGGEGRAVGKGEDEFFNISLDPSKVLPDYISKLSRAAANAQSAKFAIEQFGKPATRKSVKRMIGLADSGQLSRALTPADRTAAKTKMAQQLFAEHGPLAPDKLRRLRRSKTYKDALKEQIDLARTYDIPASMYNMVVRNASRSTGRLAPTIRDSELMRKHPLPGQIAQYLAGGVDFLNDTFKRAALISGAHHIANVIDDTSKLGVSGVSPARLVEAIPDVVNRSPNYREAKLAGTPLGSLGSFDLAQHPEEAFKFALKEKQIKAGMPSYVPGKFVSKLPQGIVGKVETAGNWLDKKTFPIRKGYGKLTSLSERLGADWNDLSRMAAYRAGKAEGLGPVGAAAKSTKALFDYQDSSTPVVGFASNLARQVMPFGNYNVRSAISAPTMALQNPSRVRNVFRAYENQEQQMEGPDWSKDMGVAVTQDRDSTEGLSGKLRQLAGGREGQYDEGLRENVIPKDQFHTAGSWATPKGIGQSIAPPLQMFREAISGEDQFGNEQGTVSGLLPAKLRGKLGKYATGPNSPLFANYGDANVAQYAGAYIPRALTVPIDYAITKDPALTPIFAPEGQVSDFPLDKRADRLTSFLGKNKRIEFPALAQKLLNEMYSEEVIRKIGKSSKGPGAQLLKDEKKLQQIKRR